MVRPIVQHVAALTEGPQIFQPIVGGIAVQVRRCEHDARHPEPSWPEVTERSAGTHKRTKLERRDAVAQ